MRLQQETQAGEREEAGGAWQDRDLVFAQPDSSPLDPRRDWEDGKELIGAAGVRDVRVHDVRDTAGTPLVAQGDHIRAVQEILGHSDVRTTEGYTHVASEIARDAAARMGRALWGAEDA